MVTIMIDMAPMRGVELLNFDNKDQTMRGPLKLIRNF